MGSEIIGMVLVYRIHFIDTFSIVYRLGSPFIIVPIAITASWMLREIPII